MPVISSGKLDIADDTGCAVAVDMMSPIETWSCPFEVTLCGGGEGPTVAYAGGEDVGDNSSDNGAIFVSSSDQEGMGRGGNTGCAYRHRA